MDLNDRYINNTEEYERALSVLLTPNGKRLSTLAENQQISKTVLQKITRYLVEEHIILLDSDGEKSDPRIYRNNVMSMFQMIWRIYSVYGPDSLSDKICSLNDEIHVYQKETGYDNPQELLEAIKEDTIDVSHINAGETGEIFWDIYIPWSNSVRLIENINITMKLTEDIDELENDINMKIKGQFGDFSNMNAVRAKLGLDDQPADNYTLREDGTLSE